jgi:hypothetical protein
VREGDEEVERMGTHFCVPVVDVVGRSGHCLVTSRLGEEMGVQVDGWGSFPSERGGEEEVEAAGMHFACPLRLLFAISGIHRVTSRLVKVLQLLDGWTGVVSE